MRQRFVLLRVRVARIWQKPGSAEVPAPGQPSRSLRFAVCFVACWLIAIAFPIIDLFDVEAGTRSFSRAIYNLVMGTTPPDSWLLPKANPAPAKDPAKQVAVVLVDEETLDVYKVAGERTWPASARFFHQALLSIWRYKPRAVFVDMMFIDPLPGPSFTPFSDIAKLYQQKGIPLLIMEPTYTPGHRPQQEFKTSKLPAMVAELHKDYQSRPVKPVTPDVANLINDLEMVEPVAALASLDVGVLRSYELYGLNGDDKPRKAAAVRLYELATGMTLDLTGAPLEIFWDLRVPPTNARWMNCVESGPANPFSRAWRAIFAPSSMKQTCGTVPSVPIAELFLGDVDEDAKGMIENNFVLFGANVVGGDAYTVPVSDRLPGVYVHAMALENLLAFGSNYIRTSLQIGSFRIGERGIVWLFEAPIVALIVSFFALSRRSRAPHEDEMLDKLLKVLVHDAKLGLAASAAGFVASTILLSTLLLAPLNWFGMGALAALTNEIRKWTRIEDRVLAVLQAPPGQAAEQMAAGPEVVARHQAEKESIGGGMS